MHYSLNDYFVSTKKINGNESSSNISLYDDLNFSQSKKENEMYCDLCKINYSDSSHLTSIGHQSLIFSKTEKINNFYIGSNNFGYNLLKKSGWDGNSGLGANEQGRVHPVTGVIKKNRFGIGIKSKHVSSKPKRPPALNKKQIKEMKYAEDLKTRRLNLLFSNRSEFQIDYLENLLFDVNQL